MPKAIPSSKSRRRAAPVHDRDASVMRPLASSPTTHGEIAPQSSSETALPPFQQQRAQAINDDIRGLFPRLKLSEKQWKKLEWRMRSPFDISAGAPTQEQLLLCESGEYCFGFYVTSNDLRDFAKRHNHRRSDNDKRSLEDFLFTVHTLSLVMDGNRMVALQRGFISEWHKEHIKGVEEKAGEIGYVMTVVNSDEYEAGYKPTNREIYELQKALRRKPCWFEAYD